MDEPKATVAGPDAPKRRGRPPKRAQSDRELIEKLAKRIDELESEKSEGIELKEIKVAPGVADEIKPGTLIQIGTNQDGSPIYRKKPWRLDDFKKLYEMTNFYAPWAAPVTINNVTVQIKQGENTVPVNFADEYRKRMAIQHADYASLLPSPSPNAVYEINEAARKSPGTRVFSGLHHIGVGLNVQAPENAEESKES